MHFSQKRFFFGLFAPENSKKDVFEKFSQARFCPGDSSRCTFLKNVVFELFVPKNTKKDVFEKLSQARFLPGDSSRCTFLKNVVFDLFAPENTKKYVLRISLARFLPGPLHFSQKRRFLAFRDRKPKKDVFEKLSQARFPPGNSSRCTFLKPENSKKDVFEKLSQARSRGTQAGALFSKTSFLSFSRPKTLQKDVFEKLSQARFPPGDSSRCIFLKNVFFFCFSRPKTLKKTCLRNLARLDSPRATRAGALFSSPKTLKKTFLRNLAKLDPGGLEPVHFSQKRRF